MNLTIKDLIELLHFSEKKIYRLIKENRIPFYKINNQYRFNKHEINEWILNNKINVTKRILDFKTTNLPVNLKDLLIHGGIFYNIEGNNVKEVIENAVNIIPTPKSINKKTIIKAILDREKLMSTAIGNGLALPHSRNPIITYVQDARISLCFLKNKVDFKAIDKIPVKAIFILLTANPKRHLEILSKLSYLCQQNEFRKLLSGKYLKENILKYIEKKEKEWMKKEY